MSTSVSLTEPGLAGPAPSRGGAGRRAPVFRRWWPLVVLGVIAVSALFVVVSNMRPSYDGFGFLVWGRQVLHWNLNTDGAPSWKPLPFLFTLPYAVAGRSQMWLWMVTAVAGAMAGSVFAARVAFRLTGPCPQRRYARYVAGAFAGVAVLGINTYSHLVLIANSDPLIVAVCLAAIDCHLSKRPRLAFTMLVLASLGRPEAWVFAGFYALWAWRAVPTRSMRVVAVLGLALIPAFWFTIPAITSHSWFIAGDLALNQQTAIHGNKIFGVFSRLRSLYELPMQLAVLAGIGLAALRRDRTTLGVAVAAVVWVVVEIAFAYHGWSAVSRYMIEPAAVMVVIAGGAVGRLLADPPTSRMLRFAGPLAVLVLIGALAPTASTRAKTVRREIDDARVDAKQIDRLHRVITRVGGPAKVRSCGQPVSFIGFQSTIAWEVGLNVGNVGYKPGRSIHKGTAVVVFKPHRRGWQVRPYNLPKPKAADCDALRTDTDFDG